MVWNRVHIERRRPWVKSESVVLIGPGGVGKSSLGRALGPMLGWPVVDLDAVYCEEIGTIGPFIGRYGYERYRAENLKLAERLFVQTPTPMVFVASSGFLAGTPGSSDNIRARQVLARGFAISILPMLNVDAATNLVVARQLERGFGLERDSEERKFRERFPIYREAGDMLVVSTESPSLVAGAVAQSMKGFLD